MKPGPKPLAVTDRFFAKLDRSGGQNACHIWTAGTYRNGYGMFWTSGRQKVRAHRFAYELAFGRIPHGNHVCHRCDEPLCCNPAHLFVGTDAENMADMVSKGRQARGSRRPDALLNERQVRHILRLKGRLTRREIGEAFGVSYRTIGNIHERRSWRHVSEPSSASKEEIDV